MLFDFHQKQNAKKANSIHATYLVSGTKHTSDKVNGTNGRSDEDASMRSSPFMSSMPEQEHPQPEDEPVKKSALLIVREEELARRSQCISYSEIPGLTVHAETRAEFSTEVSIHIYSLEPGPLEVRL